MIYSTLFDPQTRQPLEPSTDSGFNSLDEVREVMGPPDSDYAAMCFYGHGSDCWVFSRVPFLLTGPATAGNVNPETIKTQGV